MAELRNLTDENVEDVEELFERIQKHNADATLSIKPMSEMRNLATVANDVVLLHSKIDTMMVMLKNIFGNSVLINGQFVDPMEKSNLGRK